jgi:hypothetical protein
VAPGGTSGLLDIHRPVDAEPVFEPPHFSTPGLFGEWPQDGSAVGQPIEDPGEPVPVAAPKGDGHVVSRFGWITGVAIGGEKHRPVALQPERLQVQVSSQQLVIELQRLAGPPLKVDVGIQLDLAYC